MKKAAQVDQQKQSQTKIDDGDTLEVNVANEGHLKL